MNALQLTDTSIFEYAGTAAAAIATHVGLADPHTQYLLKTAFVPPGSTTQVLFNDGGAWGGDAGMTYAKASDALTVGGYVVTPAIRPAVNSTTAGQWQDAAGTPVLTIDTTNNIVQPASSLQIRADGTAAASDTLLYARQLVTTNSARYGVRSNHRVSGASVAITTRQEAIYGSVTCTAGPNAISTLRGVVGEALVTTAGAVITTLEAVTALATVTGGTVTTLRSFSLSGGIFGGTVTTYQALYIDAVSGATKNYSIYAPYGQMLVHSGNASVGHTADPVAAVDIAASSTARASLRIRAGAAPTTPNTGDIWNDGALVAYNIDATTNTVVNSLKLRRGSSGTPAAGFGLGIVARLESSTTEDQDAGRLMWSWNDATHATRAAKGRLTAYYTATERECIAWAGGSSAAQVGFLGATPTARTSAYAPTNVTTDRSYDADATTLDELADVVGTLIADLQLFGLLG